MVRLANPNMKFSLGKIIVATPGAVEALLKANQSPADFIARHVAGDWGDLSAEDKRLNDEAVADNDNPETRGRVFSAYKTANGEKIWVITEASRESTCILLPSEY